MMPISFRTLTLSGFLLVTALSFSHAQAAIFVNDSGQCLDAEYVGKYPLPVPVATRVCNSTFEQQWNFEGLAIQSVGTTGAGAKCLGIWVIIDPNLDGEAGIADCDGGSGQKWFFFNGQLFNMNSGKCLSGARILSCDGTPGQRWHIRS